MLLYLHHKCINEQRREDFRTPSDVDIAKAEALKPKTGSLDNGEIAFLKDIQEHPDNGLASRYERLGLSVRQGQKLIEVFVSRLVQ